VALLHGDDMLDVLNVALKALHLLQDHFLRFRQTLRQLHQIARQLFAARILGEKVRQVVLVLTQQFGPRFSGWRS
jgi:hypothetical protein